MHQSYQSFGEYLDSLTFDFDQKKQILLNGFNDRFDLCRNIGALNA